MLFGESRNAIGRLSTETRENADVERSQRTERWWYSHAHVASYIFASQGSRFHPPPPTPDHPSMSSQISAVGQAKLNPSSNYSNQIPNSPTQKRACHLVSLPYSTTALAPPSFPNRPGPSILIDCRLEDSSMAENDACCWTGKKLTNRRQRRTSFAQHPRNDC